MLTCLPPENLKFPAIRPSCSLRTPLADFPPLTVPLCSSFAALREIPFVTTRLTRRHHAKPQRRKGFLLRVFRWSGNPDRICSLAWRQENVKFPENRP